MESKILSMDTNEFEELAAEQQRVYTEFVELDKDMYCYTICAFMSQNKFNPAQLEVLLTKCIMVFFLQIVLTSFFYFHMADEKILKPDFAL